MARKSLKQETDVIKNDIVKAVESCIAVAEYLRTFADQAAQIPGVHPEVVKSALLVRAFLLNDAKNAKDHNPALFNQGVSRYDRDPRPTGQST